MRFFRKAAGAIREGLARTRSILGAGLRSLLAGRRLDDDLIDEIEASLIGADVGVKATTEIIGELREAVRKGELEKGEDAIDFLKSRLKRRWDEAPIDIAVADSPPTVVLVVGVNGVGKTTSVAKIAHTLRAEGRSVVLAAADTFRAGAVEQLAIWADRLGVDLIRGAAGADPAAVVFDAVDAALARKADVLLIDTAGRLHVEANLMRQLVKIREVIARKIPGAPHEVLLVLDATSGQNGLQQATVFGEAVGVTGIFLAKLDGTARGGIVVAIRDALKVPVKLVGVGERVEDVQPFDPDAFIDAMFAAESESASTS
ncbi:MAG: signal recognition particle-docking protein FtsY [Planctomycetota bacterium]|nr:signal recognition particle-docking protein FtsY [Planctomycetota bacterium]